VSVVIFENDTIKKNYTQVNINLWWNDIMFFVLYLETGT